jgi:hypothetical protein
MLAASIVMEAESTTETSVNFFQITRRNILENRRHLQNKEMCFGDRNQIDLCFCLRFSLQTVTMRFFLEDTFIASWSTEQCLDIVHCLWLRLRLLPYEVSKA